MEIWYGVRIALRQHFFLIARFTYARDSMEVLWEGAKSGMETMYPCRQILPEFHENGRRQVLTTDGQISNSDALTSPYERPFSVLRRVFERYYAFAVAGEKYVLLSYEIINHQVVVVVCVSVDIS